MWFIFKEAGDGIFKQNGSTIPYDTLAALVEWYQAIKVTSTIKQF